mgnify:CR=1 FL=1
MQKAKLGISVGLLGAAIYFTSLFSGYLVPVILTGYVLLFEENDWLRKNAVKAVSLTVFFSFVIVVINLIPNVISFINYIVSMFGGNFHIAFISNLVNAATSAIDIIEKVLFIGLGLKALNQGSISVPVVDKLINKYM